MNGPYGIILADPPWPYDFDWGNGAAKHTYPPMEVADICALPVKGIADKDAYLFLWVTNPFLVDGSGTAVCRAWGFTPKTLYTWVKTYRNGTPECGMGYYGRSSTEHIIVATRGKVTPTDERKQIRMLFSAVSPRWAKPKTYKHSEKPSVHDMLERLCGDLPRVELFARALVPGWDAAGHGVDGGRDIHEFLEGA